MSKIFTIRLEVPSRSREVQFKAWLQKLLEEYRMKVLDVEETK